MNLVSHDCHSYPHITLAKGIPPRKANMMAGENATNDVDEEVYGNDGAERHEAQEAQLVIDEQSPMRIKPDSLTFLVKRKQQERYVLLNSPQTLRGWHTTRHTFHSEIGARSMLRVVDDVLRTGRVVVNETADTLPKFQTDYMFIGKVGECKTQPCITCVETRSGVVISFMCARKVCYEDLTKEILATF